ncbi:PREDICTED: zinc finger protein CONSTANS-LIKE 8 [Fragaria vesca subsp. vesca]|uniref:zinc finger protein CONSTANS-LIKE 8 n=1 Tax=Fragaria vesca subsp. vesca TaxID=101020 RepID=UPI0002C3747A|nr:PREDICTED: zinc finger protein CONSTANS-LIKE 8 [Fragaria vesca subsp. vesca]
MCHNKNSPPPNHDRHVKLIQTRSISMMKIIKEEEEEVEEEIKPAQKPKRAVAARKSRKKRSRRKKPKYLSLRSSRLSARNDAVSATAVDDVDSKMTEAAATRRGQQQQQQLNLFPLHPELNAAEAAAAADHQSDDSVALLFESDGGATLHGLLTSADTATTTTTSTMSSDHDQAESNYGYRRGGGDDIVRTAMRGSGGDRSVGKWVCYSELVKEEVELTATTSSASTCCSVGDDRKSHQDQRLALKLDYEEVLNAWSDKGSLYIKTEDGEPPQTVPDLLQDQLFQHLHDSSANIEDLWKVPEEEEDGSLERKRMQRQESLLRYKRKRENRLFSKQIRYEVRKLNAEKRPRVKGRFVRSS